MIRKMTAADDATTVAELIYGTDGILFPFLFGRKDKAVSRLATLVQLDRNAFSHERIFLFEEEGTIRGILVETDVRHDRRETDDFVAAFRFGELLGLLVRQICLFPVLRRDRGAYRYIQNLSVDPTFRGKGIGSALLEDAIARAERDGVAALHLDVSVKNDIARNLYEKHGFRVFAKRRIWGVFPLEYAMRKRFVR